MMKKLCILPLLLAFVACTHIDYARRLVDADSLLSVRPDSALTLLRSISPARLHTEEERMRHALLTVEAECRNRIPQRDDSLLRVAVDYFHRTDNERWEARGEYVRGYVLYNYLKEGAEAVEAYHRAEDLAKSAEDNRLLVHIYNGVAYMHHSQGMSQKADSLYKIVEQMAIQLKDTVLWLEAVGRQSIHLIGQGKPHYKEAEQKLLQNYEIASRYGYPLYQCSNALNLSLLYSYMRNGEQALRFAKKALELQREDTTMRSTAILLIGESFYRLGIYDSASIYFNRLLVSSQFNIRSNAYMRLSDIAEKQGDTQKALEYEKLRVRNEKLYQQQSQTTDIQLAEQEWDHAQKQRNMRQIIYVCLCVILCLSGILCVITIRRHKIRKRRQVIIEIRMQQWMDEHARFLPALSSPVALFQAEPLATEVVEAKGSRSFDFDVLQVRIRETEVYRKMQRILNHYKKCADYEEHFTMDDRYALIDAIDHHTHGFTSYLKQTCDALNEEDIYFCCFHLLGLKASQIAVIVEQDRSNIYKRQKALLKDKFKITTKEKLENVLKSI